MDNFIDLLKKSIEKVDSVYFSSETPEETKQYNERVFCYELYHRMRQTFPRSSEWRIEAEIPKVIGVSNEETTIGGMTIVVDTENDSKKVIPDMVIHKGQNKKEKGNYLVMEVKNSIYKANIEWDLFKLMSYINQLSYEHGVYLQINRNLSNVTKDLKDLFQNVSEGDKQLLNKITILTVTINDKEKKVVESGILANLVG